VQTAFQQLGLLKGAAPLKNPGWDYTTLATGLKNADTTGLALAKPKFKAAQIQEKVEKQINVELGSYEEASALPPFEIYFGANQKDFAASDYTPDFKQMLDLSQTASGMVFIIEGHSAPDGYNKKKAAGASAAELEGDKQVLKNLSKMRADAVKASWLGFCAKEGVTCDESQFITVGRGIETPKFATPKNEAEWKKNRRVVFRPKAVESSDLEMDHFEAGK
jgi:outer membrane protein OmpA-like peptidoglycan-associated protein